MNLKHLSEKIIPYLDIIYPNKQLFFHSKNPSSEPELNAST